jgi:serine/threonine protein kinase
MSLAPGTRLGPYIVDAALGAGGMGAVYRARDTRLDRTVAIKVLTGAFAAEPESRQRLEQEARAIAALNDPQICTIHDVAITWCSSTSKERRWRTGCADLRRSRATRRWRLPYGSATHSATRTAPASSIMT